MDKVFQVFVSSTFVDLEDERRRVSDSLAKAGYIAAGMELFPASDEDQFDFIKRVIDRSDYYIVIVGNRYGSVAADGLSYTEKEFDYARSKGIRALAFLHKDPGSIPAKKSDQDADKQKKLEAFTEKLRNGRMIDHWENKDDLCTKVVIAVAHSVNLYPATGWVRGDNAIDPKLLQDMERVRAENADLREKLSKLQGSLAVEFDPSIAGPNTEIKFQVKETRTNNFGGGSQESLHGIQTTFKEIFLRSYHKVLEEPSDWGMQVSIGRSFAPLDSEQKEFQYKYSIEKNDVLRIRNQLEALGLIEVKAAPGSQGGTKQATWVATEKGRKYFSFHAALKPV